MMREVTLLVDEATAATYEAASPEVQARWAAEFRRALDRLESPTGKLLALMDEISAKARERGMTEEVEEELLRELEALPPAT